jgi:hypothetical protein
MVSSRNTVLLSHWGHVALLWAAMVLSHGINVIFSWEQYVFITEATFLSRGSNFSFSWEQCFFLVGAMFLAQGAMFLPHGNKVSFSDELMRLSRVSDIVPQREPCCFIICNFVTFSC